MAYDGTVSTWNVLALVPANAATVSCLGLSLVAGFGSLLPFYIPKYAAKGATYADITHLMTYPTLFM